MLVLQNSRQSPQQLGIRHQSSSSHTYQRHARVWRVLILERINVALGLRVAHKHDAAWQDAVVRGSGRPAGSSGMYGWVKQVGRQAGTEA
jgi:hypothetical protein